MHSDLHKLLVCQLRGQQREVMLHQCSELVAKTVLSNHLLPQDLVGGWDAVCRDINRLPLLHDRSPGCTISK